MHFECEIGILAQGLGRLYLCFLGLEHTVGMDVVDGVKFLGIDVFFQIVVAVDDEIAFFDFHVERSLFPGLVGNKYTEVWEYFHDVFLMAIIGEMLDALHDIEQYVEEV
jgi:hypothetical protein